MNLPFIKKQKETKDFFLSLLIKPYRIAAILFEKTNSNLLIVSTKEEELEKEVNSISGEELVEVSDKVISFVEESVPQGTALEKTILAVPYDWISEGEIKREYLNLLKNVRDELGLVIEGFIVSIEAIIRFLQEKEGAPISSIFVEIAKNTIFIYVVRAGNIIEVKSTEAEGGIVETVEKLFLSIEKLNNLPPKLVLLDYEDGENIQQEFLSYSWSKDIPFLHVPQVVVLEKGFENEAVINGVANKMKSDVLQDVKSGVPDIDDKKSFEETPSDEFGFLKEKDVDEKKEYIEAEGNLVPVLNMEFGENKKNIEDDEYKEIPKPHNKKNYMGIFLPALSLLKKIKMPKIKGMFFNNFVKIPIGRRAIIGGILAAAVAIFLSAIYYNFILKASVTVFSDQKEFNKDTSIILAPNGETKENTLKITTITEEVSGDGTNPATGKKETGEKARGEVTIYNKTEEKKTFPKGTVIVGSNSLEFRLTDEVTVASTSSFATNFSNVKAKVEASTFGKEYNLPSGTNFTVKNNSSTNFIAKNDSAFSGGTKKETKVVSKQDIEDAKNSLTSDLAKKALAQAGSKLGEGEALVPAQIAEDVTSEKLSKKEGEEADIVSVSETIKFTLGIYTKKELEQLIKGISDGQIPDSYELIYDSSRVEMKNVRVGKKDTVEANLSVQAKFIPHIDIKKLTNSIRGKGIAKAEEILKSTTGVTDQKIILIRKFPFLPSLLPQNAKNITIDIKT
ncbi:MAG: hypothetical protein AUK12_01320 [Candidatus Levybacteria bacterium CG2_30_37_29]|nr:MAG: hypothetical protein AUK12_01320 [Candidatus Levybacteria bacterium CG2_30_37_29]